MSARRFLVPVLAVALAHCGPGSSSQDAEAMDASDMGVEDVPIDRGPRDVQPTSTAHCTYEPIAPTGRAGGMVAEAPLRAGAAEGPLELPIGSGLGAFTVRARFLGSSGSPDNRLVDHAGWFNGSGGYEQRTMARALALTAGDETVIILKADLGAAEGNVAHDVAAMLGPEFAGKIVFSTNHSHSAPGHHIANDALAALGFGPFRSVIYQRMVRDLVALSRRALEARVPARLGILHDGNFDPENRINRERRSENDHLPGGRGRKDKDLFVLRVDAMDGSPIAAAFVFGIHGTLQDADNPLASGDAPAAIERALEESFDRRVVVMHLQGAGGDVSPAGSGGFDCGAQQRDDRIKFCFNYSSAEGLGRNAVGPLRAAWERAGMSMRDSLAIEALTRSVSLGTDWRNFTVRDGGLSYAPFDPERPADRMIFQNGPDGGAGNGVVASPIDEWNAPNGAALCGNDSSGLVSRARMPGTDGLRPYRSCQRVDLVANFFNPLLEVQPPPIPNDRVICAATRTNVTAVRLGEHVFVTMPGEVVTLLADHLRARSPVPPERTVVLGYANGHVGYMLTAEDWLAAGYEPSINFWGPLEAEHIGEEAMALARLAMTPERENGGMGTTRVPVPSGPDNIPPPDPAPRAGQVPTTIPSIVFARRFPRWTNAQPSMQVRRLESARFVWIGEDPMSGTPAVTLEQERTPGMGDFMPVTRRSGRPVTDGDMLVTWTPDPLIRQGTNPRTHYWTVEWQAVAPWGMPSLEALGDRAGMPLGRYRFNIRGTNYNLQSQPFEVTAGNVNVRMLARSGNNITAQIAYQAAEGWRALDVQIAPNDPVPVRQAVTVELQLPGGMNRRIENIMPSAMGAITVDAGADATRATGIRVLDRFNNVGTATF